MGNVMKSFEELLEKHTKPAPATKRAKKEIKYPVPQPKEGCMSIDEYVFDKGITMTDFAEMIGYGLGYVCQCNRGSIKMSNRMKYLISKVTKGKVKLI